MPESEFAKLCTGYAYRSLSRDQIISQSEELEREGLVYIELDTNATLCRYKNELGCVRQKIEKSGSLLRTVVINERYLQQAVDAETFRALQKVTVLDSYGINSVNIKDDTLKEVTTFFLRDCTLAAILCSEKNVTAAAGMYKFFCECATSAYMSKEQLKKKIMESIKSEGSDAGDGSLILTAVMTCAKFIAPNLYGLAEYFIKPSSSSSSSKSSSGSDGNKSNGNADNGGIAQSASVLSNILFCVTMLDEYETFERKAYEFGLRLGKCFESPPTFDNCFFISLKEGSRGRENCEELLGSLKRYVCKINPNRAKDDSIKAMLEKLSDKGFMYVDIEKKKAIETHVNERLEMWKLGFSI